MFNGLKQGQTINLDRDASAHQGLRYALNAIHKRDLMALSNEGGSKLQALLKEGFSILGQVYINQNDKVVFLGNGTDSEVGRIRNKTYETVFANSNLNFKLGSYISGTFKYNENEEVIIYFTDYVNDIRFLNIDNVPTISDIRQLRLFRYISGMSSVSVDKVNSSGGQLNLGQYFFFYSYVDENGVETPIINGTRGVQIGKESIEDNPYLKYRGGSSDETTNKSIELSISGIDTNYSLVRLYVLKHYDGNISSVERLADADIRSSALSFTYTGLETTIDSSIDKLNEVIAYYSTAKSLTQVDNALYIANLKQRQEDPKIFQPIANAITVNRVEQLVTRYGTDYNWKAPLANNQRGHFMNDEVYALYISFIWNDGSETAAYHIPGREQNLPTGLFSETDSLEDLKAYAPWSGTAPSADIDNFLSIFPDAKIFHYYGFESGNNMGYWENKNEVYPNIPEIWGTNAGQPVRHHRFPAPQEVEYIRNDDNYYVNGVQLQNVVIPVGLQNDIIGWKLYYAKRTDSNKRILDQSFLSVGERAASSGTSESAFLNGRSGDAFGTIDPQNIAASVPFSMINNQKDPNSVSYIRLISTLSFNSTLVATNTAPGNISYRSYFREAVEYANFNFLSNSFGRDFTLFPTIKKLAQRQVAAAIYINEVLGTDLENDVTRNLCYRFGFSSDITNTTTANYIANFHTGFEDLYSTFDKQALVFTGYVHTNTAITTSSHIFGGDCNVGNYCHLGLGVVAYSSGVAGILDEAELKRDLFHFTIEQQENIGLRQEGEDLETAPNQKYFPAYPAAEILDMGALSAGSGIDQQESFYTEYIELNRSYSAVPDFNATAPQDARKDTTSQNLITRVIRSNTHNPGNLVDQFRAFAANNYIDLPLNRGPIEVIKSYNNLLLIHLERALAITKGKEQLQLDNTNVYLGTSDILQQPPEEIQMTEEGHAGNQNIEGSLVTPFGYFFIDREAKVLYQFNGRLLPISEMSISNWLYDNGGFYTDSLQYKPVLDPEDAQLMSYRLGYDARYKRILITQHNIKPTSELLDNLSISAVDGAIILKEDGYYYKLEATIGGSTPLTETKIQYSNTTYFTRISFTLSYDPIVQGFLSFHSYSPDLYLIDRENLQTVSNSRLWEMNDLTNPGLFYGTRYPFEVDLVTNFNPNLLGNGANTRLRNIVFNTTSLNQQLVPQYRDTFDSLYVYNENQTTGLIPLTDLRHIRGEWSVNKLRDISSGLNVFEDRYKLELNDSNVDTTLPWHKKNRFFDTYVGYRLVYNNTDNNLLTLHASTAVPVQTRR